MLPIKGKTGKTIVFWLPVLFWMGLIFFLSSFHKLQASQIGWQDFVTRKLAHFLEYAILAVLFYRLIKNSTPFSLKKCFFLALVLTVLYALSDEFHQTRVNGRTGRFFDIGVDSFGALGGLSFIKEVVRRLPKNYQDFFKKFNL